MKKLVAMLLAVALIAALGVTAFATPTYTNAESRDHYQDRINYFADFIADAKYKKSTLSEVQSLWDHYFTQKGMIETSLGPTATAAEKEAATMDLTIDMKLALAELKAKYAGVEYTSDAVWDLYNFDKIADRDAAFTIADNEASALDKLIDQANTKNADEGNDFYLALFTKLAEKDAEAAAAAKAAAEVAAKIEAATKGIDASTPAGKLLYDGTVAKMWAQESLTAAKKAADSAKKAISVAQKGAITNAQAAVLDAQAVAYQNMAAEINTAVADYVDSVYVAIADFYDSLNP